MFGHLQGQLCSPTGGTETTALHSLGRFFPSPHSRQKRSYFSSVEGQVDPECGREPHQETGKDGSRPSGASLGLGDLPPLLSRIPGGGATGSLATSALSQSLTAKDSKGPAGRKGMEPAAPTAPSKLCDVTTLSYKYACVTYLTLSNQHQKWTEFSERRGVCLLRMCPTQHSTQCGHHLPASRTPRREGRMTPAPEGPPATDNHAGVSQG